MKKGTFLVVFISFVIAIVLTSTYTRIAAKNESEKRLIEITSLLDYEKDKEIASKEEKGGWPNSEYHTFTVIFHTSLDLPEFSKLVNQLGYEKKYYFDGLSTGSNFVSFVNNNLSKKIYSRTTPNVVNWKLVTTDNESVDIKYARRSDEDSPWLINGKKLDSPSIVSLTLSIE